ncbi:MAG: hypothetical protein QOD69_3395 [Solirubrobacteraceae bacterium]|jgi:hypothetical protein|nr:hypothetical protein [Solirubrobacteraceae bacterium]
MRSLSLGLLAAAALVAAGCGGGSDPATPEDVVSTAVKALGKGDAQKVCDQLDGDAKRKLVAGLRKGPQGLPHIVSTNCVDGIGKVYAKLPAPIRAVLVKGKVDKATITGDTATVRVSLTTLRTELQKTGDTWLISGGFFEK